MEDCSSIQESLNKSKDSDAEMAAKIHLYCFGDSDEPEPFEGLGKRQRSYEPDFGQVQKRAKPDSAVYAQHLATKHVAKLHSSLSISHGQPSHRFTCLNGHNFYLPVE